LRFSFVNTQAGVIAARSNDRDVISHIEAICNSSNQVKNYIANDVLVG
jgi:hypothetical protein